MLNEPHKQKIIDVSVEGDVGALKHLLNVIPCVDVKIDALWMAALNGKEECVRVLIGVLQPLLQKDNDFAHQALLYAAEGGNTTCVELLLPFSSARCNTMALKQAAKHGHAACVAILVPVAWPEANNSEALRHAAKWGHNDCVDVLYPVSNPFEALKQLRNKHPNKEQQWAYLAQLCQRAVLQQALQQTVNSVNPFAADDVRKM